MATWDSGIQYFQHCNGTTMTHNDKVSLQIFTLFIPMGTPWVLGLKYSTKHIRYMPKLTLWLQPHSVKLTLEAKIEAFIEDT